jgi:AraC-like DNA-binding protein
MWRMSDAQAAFPPLAARVREQGDGVRRLHERGLTWVSIDPLADAASTIEFAVRRLPGLGLIAGELYGIRHDHTRRRAGDANDDFSIHLNLSGRSIVTGRNREITLADGDAVLLNYGEARVITRPEHVRYAIARIPRAALAPLVRDIDDAVMRPIPCGSGALSLLTSYVGALIDDPALEAADMRRLFVTQLCDLVAVTIGATRDADAAAEGRGLRAARLRAIKDDIETHLARDDLSPLVVARRQRISDSYIRKLFEGEGTSFSAYVLGRRLARAHRMLSDPRRADRSIASIAFAAGFGDLSYFNRTFRRTFGATPSELREAAHRQA